jgi:DNA-binding LacI/PurR family transcriptional regulator
VEPISRNPERVTIQDVANHLGISKATVCRALLQRSRVAPDTRRKVLEAAEKLGYAPDPTLRALSKHRWAKHTLERSSYRIALVEINSNRTGNKAAAREPTTLGAIGRARELGLELDTFIFEEYSKSSRLGDVLFHRGYEGILFSIRGPVTDWNFPWDKFSCLAISFDHPSHRLHQVCSDWFNAVAVAVEDVLARGYKRPGFLQFQRENPAMDLRTKAAIQLWRNELQETHETIPGVFEYFFRAAEESDPYVSQRGNFNAWFEENRPDVVIDGGYLGYWWLKDMGLRMPEDVGYLRLRHTDTAEPSGASGVDHKLAEQGRWGIDLLYNMIQLNIRGLSPEPVRITVKCEPREGNTLQPVRE